MAYDKVVDSTQLETAITATANAIREKTGDTALLEWVASKGFADAIAGIEAGGAKFACGEITPASDTTELVIQHDLGITPNVVFIFVDGSYNTPANSVNGCFTAAISGHFGDKYGIPHHTYYRTSSGQARSKKTTNSITEHIDTASPTQALPIIHSANANTFTWGVGSEATGVYYIRASKPYYWLALNVSVE